MNYDFFNGTVDILNKGDIIAVELNNYDDYKFCNFIPVVNGFAPIGLVDKYVTSATYEKFGENKYTVLNGGKFAFYAENEPKEILVDGEKIAAVKTNNYYVLDLGEISASHILEFEF